MTWATARVAFGTNLFDPIRPSPSGDAGHSGKPHSRTRRYYFDIEYSGLNFSAKLEPPPGR
jgi:hypothetical protein